MNVDSSGDRPYRADMPANGQGFLDSYLPYLLRQADQTLSAPFYDTLNHYGVARSEWRVLAVLHELGDLGVKDLANAALSPQPTVTHALRRLEARGLVIRTQGTQDKRQRLVSVTATGKELTQNLINQAKALETDQLAQADDLTDLIAQLKSLTATVEARSQQLAQNATQAG